MNYHNERTPREKRYISKQFLDKWKVLVVDDQLDNLLVAELVLKYHGAEVVRASNGIEGLRVLETFEPTLILLDLSMPQMDGWEMFQIIRSQPSTSQIPVIALTARASPSDRARVIAAGFTGYITKPFSVATFVHDIADILNNAGI